MENMYKEQWFCIKISCFRLGGNDLCEKCFYTDWHCQNVEQIEQHMTVYENLLSVRRFIKQCPHCLKDLFHITNADECDKCLHVLLNDCKLKL